MDFLKVPKGDPVGHQGVETYFVERASNLSFVPNITNQLKRAFFIKKSIPQIIDLETKKILCYLC